MEDGALRVHDRAVLPLLKPVQHSHFEIRYVPALAPHERRPRGFLDTTLSFSRRKSRVKIRFCKEKPEQYWRRPDMRPEWGAVDGSMIDRC